MSAVDEPNGHKALGLPRPASCRLWGARLWAVSTSDGLTSTAGELDARLAVLDALRASVLKNSAGSVRHRTGGWVMASTQ